MEKTTNKYSSRREKKEYQKAQRIQKILKLFGTVGKFLYPLIGSLVKIVLWVVDNWTTWF
ncbi:hypothetical protein VL05_00095 [Bacillus stratosphericus]|nr:hypothetical protein BSL056_20370 [Bacillus safensis]KML06668.1 hypothetical protein VL05_00095 [Bacillus stratosphericus]